MNILKRKILQMQQNINTHSLKIFNHHHFFLLFRHSKMPLEQSNPFKQRALKLCSIIQTLPAHATTEVIVDSSNDNDYSVDATNDNDYDGGLGGGDDDDDDDDAEDNGSNKKTANKQQSKKAAALRDLDVSKQDSWNIQDVERSVARLRRLKKLKRCNTADGTSHPPSATATANANASLSASSSSAAAGGGGASNTTPTGNWRQSSDAQWIGCALGLLPGQAVPQLDVASVPDVVRLQVHQKRLSREHFNSDKLAASSRADAGGNGDDMMEVDGGGAAAAAAAAESATTVNATSRKSKHFLGQIKLI